MKIGYLHLGREVDGLRRHGKLLAEALTRRADTQVIAVSVDEPERRRFGNAGLRQAAATLSKADIVHIQFNGRIWCDGPRWVAHLTDFLDAVRVPVAATMHDVTGPPIASRGLRRSWHRFRYPAAVALAELIERAQLGIVCTSEEASRLGPAVPPEKKTVIPIFVEDRAPAIDQQEAKRLLGLDGRQVVTLLGFIHPRKGHHLAARALLMLPREVHLVFAGTPSPGHDAYLESLQAELEREGQADRLHVTGYLPDEQLDRYLAATDLGICPFRSMSASASFATWLSVSTPVLAHDLAQFREYNQMSPGAVALFDSYTVEALAEAIRGQLDADQQQRRQAIRNLKEDLSIARIAQRHLDEFQRVVSAADPALASVGP